MTELATTDLIVLSALNFFSLFAALYVLKVLQRRKDRRFANHILEQMGQQMMAEKSFMEIIQKNFPHGRFPEEGEE
jgi:hypothetical protein